MYTVNDSSQLNYNSLKLIVIDIFSMQFAFALSYFLIVKNGNPYIEYSYRLMAVITLLNQLVVTLFVDTYKDFYSRGYLKELTSILFYSLWVSILVLVVLFVILDFSGISRLHFAVTFIINALILYALRLIIKRMPFRMHNTNLKSLIVLTPGNIADKAYLQLSGTAAPLDRIITGFYITDGDMASIKREYNFPVMPYSSDSMSIIKDSWVDEALIIQPSNRTVDEEILNTISKMGVIVHFTLVMSNNQIWMPMQSGSIGNYSVISSGLKVIPLGSVFIKRAMDILGSIVGCLITALIFPFVAISIYVCSPGPVIFRQERIGKNGKIFWMYKFRTMHLDADSQKKELLSQNIMSNDLMFKMDDDPRIIDSGKYSSDGRPSGLGHFLRRTSIDELPQFWNVLKGDMSLVGTRPPTLDEFYQYKEHHKARLSMLPGITGLWQISGRNQITDFEEVVRLDMEYIKNWSIYLDCKILLKTIVCVFSRKGAQ